MTESPSEGRNVDESSSIQESVFFVQTDRDLGANNRQWLGMDIHPVVFSVSFVTIAL